MKDKIFESIINDIGDHIYLKSPFSEDRWINFFNIHASHLPPNSPTFHLPPTLPKKGPGISSRRVDTFLFPSFVKAPTSPTPTTATSMHAHAPNLSSTTSSMMDPESFMLYHDDPVDASMQGHESLEFDSLHFITLCLEALLWMGQLVEGLSQLKQRIPSEVFQLIERNVLEFKEKTWVFLPASYFHLMDTHALRDLHAKEAKLLVLRDHFLTLFSKLESTMECHKLICNVVDVMAQRDRVSKFNMDPESLPVYTMGDVWTAIQNELQRFLMNHLTSQGTTSEFMVIDLFKELSPVTQLFQFNQSSTYASILSFYQSQIQVPSPTLVNHVHDPYASDKFMEHTLLYPPDLEFISTLYTPTVDFFHRMASFSSLMSPTESSEFLDDFILTTYIPSIEAKVQSHVHKYINGSDGFILSDNNLLQSSTCLLSLIKSLCATINNVPFHRQEYIRMIQDVLSKYAEKCQSKYQSCTVNSLDQQSIFTVAGIWAQNQEFYNILTKNTYFRNEPLDVKSNERCSTEEILMESNFRSDRSFERSELQFHKKKIELLACLRVSLKWFKQEVQQLMETKVDDALEIADLELLSENFESQENFSSSESMTYSPSSITTGEDPLLMVPANQQQTISEILKSYDTLSNLCLVTLHIELRTHSIYFLDLAMREGSYYIMEDTVDPEPYILQLNNDLMLFEEIVSKTLPPFEARFVFDGLPMLFTHYFISNAHYIRRLNQQGALKMIKSIRALHQNLLNLDLCEEFQLDHARKYYEMFMEGVDNILKKIEDREPVFTLTEYKTMIHFMLDIPSLPDLIRSEDITTSATAEKNMEYYHEVVKKLSTFFDDLRP
ncbi:hypothetical protein HMI55_001435 [Coelomomyces lativittatus]|nr:hypothetical protein HMI55_001435 [Coelomomyces lativittatus]